MPSTSKPDDNSSRGEQVSPSTSAVLNPNVTQIIPWLYDAARDAGRLALSNYARTDRKSQLQAAIAIGAAAEYMGRAVLANHDPVLLAKRDSHLSLIMLSRANTTGPLDPKTLRSIDTTTVWAILNYIDPKLKLAGHADLTATVRNSAVHMALVERTLLEEAAIALTTIIAALHPFLGSAESDFWGEDLADVVQVLKDEKSNAILRAVTALIAERRAQLDLLLAGIEGSERLRMLLFLRTRKVAYEPVERHKLVDQPCPACQDDGVSTYGIEEGEPEASYRERSNGDWAELSWHRELYPFALEFNCPVCGLRLDHSQFEAAGLAGELDPEIEIVDDPSLYWEPDEDMDRDR